MIKKANKIVAIALALVSTCCFIGGCKDNANGEAVSPVRENVYDGTHILTAPDTDKYLVENGKCDYVLVLPAEDNETLRDAKNEFSYFFQMATGISLKTTTDTGLTHNANNKYISIGETELFKSADISWDKKQLGNDGVRIATKDSSIFLVGGSDRGTLNSVYTFMEITFDLQVYYYDCIEIEKNVSNKKLKAYDVTDIPDIGLRVTSYQIVSKPFSSDYDVLNFASRLRYTRSSYSNTYYLYKSYDDSSNDGSASHNTNTYILPESVYKADHMKWYSDNGKQWCYTAHGDAEEYEAMQEEILKKLTYTIKRYYDSGLTAKYINVFMEDNYEICTCNACSAISKKYGVHSAAVIMFCNDLGEKLEAWANLPENLQYEAQETIIRMLAYQDFAEPPVKYDEKTGTYSPIDEDVKMRDNVGIYLADIDVDYQQALNNAYHERTKRIVEGWGSITSTIFFWTYVTNFKYMLYMYDTFSLFTSDTLAWYANCGGGAGLYMETGKQSAVLTVWNSLKFYLNSRLQWDTSLDERELIDKWFRAMFKDAAPIMKSLFMDMRTHAATVYSENDLYKNLSCMNKVENKAYWPMATLKAWIAKCDDALLAVEKYKVIDAELYTAIKNHINAESLSPIYILLKLYESDLSKGEKRALVERVLAMQDTLPIDQLAVNQGAGTAFLTFINGIL